MCALFFRPSTALVLVLSLLVSIHPAAATQVNQHFGHNNPALSVLSTGGVTSVALQNPELTRESMVLNGKHWTQFDIAGEPSLGTHDLPALPCVTRLYQIPNTGGVELAVRAAEFTLEHDVDISLDRDAIYGPVVEHHEDIAPVDDAEHEHAASEPFVARDQWYPASPFELSAPMILRDLRVVQLTLHPLQYNPVTRELRIYSTLEADIVPTALPGLNELTRTARPSAAYAALYQDLIPNLDPAILDNQTTVPGSYLILGRNHDTVLPWIDSLATWKKLLGYSVVVDTRNNWTALQMRNAVFAAYNLFDPPLEYVTIMGDPLAGNFGMPTSDADYDHYFADLTGDNLEEVFVGRYSCASNAQFATALNKLFLYERTPDLADTGWTTRPILWATLEGTGRQNDDAVRWARLQFERYSGIHHFTIGSGPASNQTVIGALNEGTSFYFWMGGWVGQYSSGFPGQLLSTSKLPMVFLLQEWTGTFATGLSIAEEFLIAGTPEEPRGGVGSVGLTYCYHAPETNVLGSGIIYSLCNLGVNRIGPILSSAKALMVPIMGAAHPRVDLAFRGTNLMGDPSMIIWKDRLHTMTADYPATCAVGQNCVTVDVFDELGNPQENALVVLLKNGETHSRLLTDVNGHADLPVSILTSGLMQLCISRSDAAPLLGSIDCVVPDVQLAPTLWILDDDNLNGTHGNSNQHANPHEIIDLSVYLRNIGSEHAADAVTATMTTDNPQVTFLRNQVTYGSIAPGDSTAGNQAFRLQIEAEPADGECISLRINIASNAGATSGIINLIAQSSSLHFVQGTISGGDGDAILEPGETTNLAVTIQNAGHASAQNVSGVLTARRGLVRVLQSQATFGGIAPDSARNNSETLFSLMAITQVPAGTIEIFQLVVEDESAGADTLSFTLSIGVRTPLEPAGPDEFGYFAYEDSDTAFEEARAFDWVDAQQSGTDLNINDVGYEQGPAVNSVVRDLPFPFVFYGETYSQITICSNGWAAFGNQSGQDIAINFPIPGQHCPDALLAPFWDDLQTSGNLGVWEYYDAAHYRYVIEWWARSIGQPRDEQFEIVLLDPAFESARDGNGILIFQYLLIGEVVGDANNNPYATIGIAAPGGSVGLQCRYANVAASGMSALRNESAITFSTDGRIYTGILRGHVVNGFTQQVIPNARITLSVDSVLSDQDGAFTFPPLLSGVYSLTVDVAGFESRTLRDVFVMPDSAINLLIELTPAAGSSADPPLAFQFALKQNYPNPFNSSTEISFVLPHAGPVTLDLYNLAGQRVRNLLEQNLSAGEHRLDVDADNLSTGVYLYRLTNAGGQLTRKMVLLK